MKTETISGNIVIMSIVIDITIDIYKEYIKNKLIKILNKIQI